jgi:hypothetical protein
MKRAFKIVGFVALGLWMAWVSVTVELAAQGARSACTYLALEHQEYRCPADLFQANLVQYANPNSN